MPLGLGGNIMNMMFGDPEQEASDYSNSEQARNRAALGEDAQGNVLPTPAVGSAPGVGSGQIAPPMGAAPPGPGEPNATQTPKSWGSVLMDLQRRDEASQGLNQSLGMGFAAFAQPRDREMVSKMFNVNAPNELQTVQGMQNMGSLQQGQDRMNALGQQIMDPKAGPAMADRLNISWDELKARYRADPQGTGTMIQNFAQPTDQMKNLQQLTYYSELAGKLPGNNPADLLSLKNAITAGIAPADAYAMISAQIAWRQKNGDKPPPWNINDPASFRQYTANEAQKEDDRGKASATLANTQQTAEELRGNLEQLRDMPGLASILGNFTKQQAAREALVNPNVDLKGVVARGTLNQQEADAVALLRKIGGQQTSEALHSLIGTGTRVTQQEVGPLTAAISTTQDLNQDLPSYITNAINPLITKTKKLVATTYGASGNFSGMDPEYAPWVPAIYRKNGELYKEGGGGDNLADLQPITPAKLAWAKNEIAEAPGSRGDILDSLQQDGFDVTRLRKTDPSKW